MLWLILHIIFVSSSAYGEEQELRIATGESYSTVIDSKKSDGGVLTENVRRTFRAMGYKPVFEFMPWKRAYSETARTIYAATFPWFRDADREREFLFSDPLYWMPVVGVVKLTSTWKQLDFDTMRRKSSCDLLGSKGYDILKEKADVQMIFVNDINQCYQMLLNGRIDFLFMHRETAEKNLHLGIKIVPDILRLKLSLHLMISKKHKDAEKLIRSFNHSFRNLTASHGLESLVHGETFKP